MKVCTLNKVVKHVSTLQFNKDLYVTVSKNSGEQGFSSK